MTLTASVSPPLEDPDARVYPPQSGNEARREEARRARPRRHSERIPRREGVGDLLRADRGRAEEARRRRQPGEAPQNGAAARLLHRALAALVLPDGPAVDS